MDPYGKKDFFLSSLVTDGIKFCLSAVVNDSVLMIGYQGNCFSTCLAPLLISKIVFVEISIKDNFAHRLQIICIDNFSIMRFRWKKFNQRLQKKFAYLLQLFQHQLRRHRLICLNNNRFGLNVGLYVGDSFVGLLEITQQ